MFERLVLGTIIGATLGFVENGLAIRLLFRPKKPRFFGLIQGVIPKRLDEIQDAIVKEFLDIRPWWLKIIPARIFKDSISKEVRKHYTPERLSVSC